ncbi:MFS transporter [Pseudomonas sp. Leaf127]|uniref:MFS transporter n=1 Tax=Pseudomonas sp. Leaf127 TaxID=1736267 RepID=UPI0009E917F3|nr:MFS transporter [Pseudomonas sp. Leaf127]
MSLIDAHTQTVKPDNEALPDLIHRKNAVRLIPLLFICYLFAHLDRINIGFAKIQMSADLQFSNSVYGLGAGLFFVSYMLFGVPSNMVLDKVGPRRWIAFLMVSWGLMSAGMMGVETPLAFYVLRFLLGVAEAGFFPGILLFINRWFATNRRAQVTAWFAIAVPMAGVVGAPVSGWILEAFSDSSTLRGWQWMFLLEGLPVVLLGLVVLSVLPDNFNEARWLAEHERIALGQLVGGQASIDERGRFGTLLRNPQVALLIVIYSAVMLGMGVVAFWMPTLISGAGVAHSHQIGVLSAVPYLVGCFCMVLTGRSSDRRRERRWHVFIPLLATAIGIALTALAPQSLLLVMLGMVLACAGATTALAMFWQLPAGIISSRDLAIGIAFVSSCGSVASFLSPALVGWMKDSSGSASLALLLLSALILIGSVVVFALPKHQVNPAR